MKAISILLFTFAVAVAGNAQQIRPMKAADLKSYIAQSTRPLVVSFWATWCSSCNEELPYFISTIKEKYEGKVDLLLVSLDIKSYYPARITGFAAKRNYNAPLVWLNETNADVFCPEIDANWSGAIPSTLMINNQSSYRKFYEQGLTAEQFNLGLQSLLKDSTLH